MAYDQRRRGDPVGSLCERQSPAIRMSRGSSRPLLRTFTAEEEAVIRQAAARMIKYGRYHRRRQRGKPGEHGSARGYQGQTADQVLRAYTRNLRHWHELADAAYGLVQRVTGRGSGTPRSQ